MKKIKFTQVRMIIYIISILIAIFVFIGKINLPCFFYEKFGVYCPACGLTRATIYSMQFKFKEACSMNAFYTIVLLPFIIILISNDIYVILKRKFTKKSDISLVEIVLGERKI